MTSPEWEAANEDDADRWTRYQAHTGLAPDDGLVWRDRGVIIAQLTAENERLKAARNGWMETLEQWEARVAELEGSCQKLRDDYQGALHDPHAKLAPELVVLLDEWDADAENDNYSKGDAAADLRRTLRKACGCERGVLPHDRRCPVRLDGMPNAPRAADGA